MLRKPSETPTASPQLHPPIPTGQCSEGAIFLPSPPTRATVQTASWPMILRIFSDVPRCLEIDNSITDHFRLNRQLTVAANSAPLQYSCWVSLSISTAAALSRSLCGFVSFEDECLDFVHPDSFLHLREDGVSVPSHHLRLAPHYLLSAASISSPEEAGAIQRTKKKIVSPLRA